MAAQQDEDFAAMFEATPKGTGARGARRVKPGQLVEGVVVEIGADNVFIDIGTKSEARIERTQIVDKEGKLKVGRRQAARHRRDRQPLRHHPHRPVRPRRRRRARPRARPEQRRPGRGHRQSKAVKAGLEVDIGGVRAFCPASQLDMGFVQDLENFVGQKHFFKVLEIRDSGRSVVVSRKAVLKDERENQAKAVRERLTVGAELDGIVQSIQPYGAFIDLGGLEGLLHISELGVGRVDRVEDVIKVGEAIRVRVIAIDSKGTSGDLKISLSMKSSQQPSRLRPRDRLRAPARSPRSPTSACSSTPSRAAASSPTTSSASPRAPTPSARSPGKDVEVVVLGRDAKNGRLRLSIRGVAAAEERSNYKTFARETKKASGGGKGLGTFSDLLGGLDVKLPPGPSAASKPRAEAINPGKPAAPAPARAEDPNRRRRV
jgi:small subunit ribosomal protein S1